MSFANGDSVWDSCCCNEWQLVGFPITAFWDFGGDIYCFTCLHLGHTKDHMSECAWRAELGNSPGWSPSLSSGEPQVEGPADTSIRWGLAATVECINWENVGQQHKQCSGYCFALWKMGTKCPQIIVWFSGDGSINWSYPVSFQSSLPLTLLGWWWVGWNTSLTRHLFLQRCYACWIVLSRMSFFGSADSSMRPADRMSPLT